VIVVTPSPPVSSLPPVANPTRVTLPVDPSALAFSNPGSSVTATPSIVPLEALRLINVVPGSAIRSIVVDVPGLTIVRASSAAARLANSGV
jgi:hypothetical protein